jgi:hypothetical protein
MEKPLIGWSGARLQKQVLEKNQSIELKVDRSTSGKISIDRLNIRSIDFSGLPNFRVFLLEICHFSLNVLQNTKTQKLAKTSEK